MSGLSNESFESVSALFQRVSGIRLGANKHALVAGRLQRLAHEAGETDVDAYVAHIVRGKASEREVVQLIDRLTTNETYFFREPQHYKDLAERLPTLAPARELVVWSAASSSGEEAYSVAMLLADKMGPKPWRVIGTDLSTAMVESARKGLYSLERARMVPKDYLQRFCLKGNGPHEGQVLVQAELRRRVSFSCANLMEPLPDLPMFDVIFLRNVLIYFDNDAKREIVQRVIQRLRPDGVLYTGHAESLSTLNLPLRTLSIAIHGHA